MYPSSHQRICVVDDDEAVRDSLRLLLESHGYDVEDFDSAAAFLRDDQARPYDCFLVDLQMPVTSGLELIETLRQRGVGAPTLIITARIEPRLSSRVKRAQVCAVLTKPVADQELLFWLGRAGCAPAKDVA